MTDKPSLQAIILSERTRLGLSLLAVSKRADISKTTVWQLQSGGALNPSVRTIAAIAGALNVPFERLAVGALNDLERT